ncbi:hypothetical protein J1605_014435 [Eschrichtius robustus]|uniref:Purple acid phosphatase n=1 Tax=Eschrichtius robustus TaxID=9764 RepID=A0AB34GF78_ESCRO|nr:hypothetical protein J1605_014435 [Eschrichtius robustus]
MSQRLQTHKIPLSHWCPETRMLGVGAPEDPSPSPFLLPTFPLPCAPFAPAGPAAVCSSFSPWGSRGPQRLPALPLSYPGEPGCMTVTWTTWVPTPSEVQFGLQLWGPLPLRAQGTFSPFVDGGILRRKLYIHEVTLQGLLPGVQYGERGPGPSLPLRQYSGPEPLVPLQGPEEWTPLEPLVWLFLGTQGLTILGPYPDCAGTPSRAGTTLFFMWKAEPRLGPHSLLHPPGDFACNMDQDNGCVRDKFMNLIEPVAASLPYVTCPGNHEERYNFSNYKARFSMPGNSEGLWYR